MKWMIHCGTLVGVDDGRTEPAAVADAETEPAVVVADGRIEPAGVADAQTEPAVVVANAYDVAVVAIQFGYAQTDASEVE